MTKKPNIPDVNQVQVAGRLANDPEYRITDRGTARLSFRLSVNRTYRNDLGEWEDEASYFAVVAYGELAERGVEHLRKNSGVFLTGRLMAHSWRDEEDIPHSLVEIRAHGVTPLE